MYICICLCYLRRKTSDPDRTIILLHINIISLFLLLFFPYGEGYSYSVCLLKPEVILAYTSETQWNLTFIVSLPYFIPSYLPSFLLSFAYFGFCRFEYKWRVLRSLKRFFLSFQKQIHLIRNTKIGTFERRLHRTI